MSHRSLSRFNRVASSQTHYIADSHYRPAAAEESRAKIDLADLRADVTFRSILYSSQHRMRWTGKKELHTSRRS